MSLGRQIFLRNLLLLAGLLLLGASSLWGLLRLRANVTDALDEYNDIRALESVQRQLTQAFDRLREERPEKVFAEQDIRAAVTGLDDLERSLTGPSPSEADSNELVIVHDALRRLRNVMDELREPTTLEMAPLVNELNQVYEQLGSAARLCHDYIQQTQESANRELRAAIVAIGVLSAALLVGAVFISRSLYRTIMGPLDRLRAGVRTVAGGGFSERLPVTGDREFAELANDFNRMAAELDQFYHQLEQKVATKSKELVRSERLASIGFLAAGVAHEINNPLGIISGYAELSLKQTTPAQRDQMISDVRRALQIIRDEAFRCKEITGKLLTLARGSSDKRSPMSLAQVAREVAEMMQALRNYRDRRILVQLDEDEPLNVEANSTEMRQVLLNVTVNALEAVGSGVGRVRIEGRRTNGWVELSISDNGRGMTAEALERVFEPFYTDKRGAGEPGTGLGLSITHAIVESHGGRIRAESEGPGRGSRFTVQLPAYRHEKHEEVVA
ncbi:MAG: sensor histidine kinase [Tepidisphaeraceae bacterium]